MSTARHWRDLHALRQSIPAEVIRQPRVEDALVRLQQMGFERDRLLKSYQSSLSDIRSHEASLKDTLQRIVDEARVAALESTDAD